MDRTSALIIGAHTVILVFGGAITAFAYQAFSRTGSKRLKALAVGFGLITAGTVMSLGLLQLGIVELLTAVALQSLAIAAGFVVLAYSLQSSHEAVQRTGQTTE